MHTARFQQNTSGFKVGSIFFASSSVVVCVLISLLVPFSFVNQRVQLEQFASERKENIPRWLRQKMCRHTATPNQQQQLHIKIELNAEECVQQTEW